MLIYILIGVAVVIALLLLIIATRPSEFRITRSATMSAPPSAVFPQVNDFHNWRAWSPWENIDPNLQRTYDGPSAGTGAGYGWSGKKAGEGHMTITESRQYELILIKLVFVKPFAATNTTEFTFQPQGGGTAVTWSMAGKHNFMGKAMGLVMNMDKMIGKSFDEGLAKLRAVVESKPA